MFGFLAWFFFQNFVTCIVSVLLKNLRGGSGAGAESLENLAAGILKSVD